MSQMEIEQELTQHAMLVLWGQFAQRMGLIEAVEAISMRQKTRIHRPQTKVLEFMVAILAGLRHLKDVSHAAHPLDQDQAVARAWGQPAWADHSGVSRTLHAMSMEEAQEMVQVLDTLSQPFIDQEVSQAYAETGGLIWDFDLTGRPVSNTSTTYPNAAFGHMSDSVQLGYQAAMVSMHSPTYGRLWLSTASHPGDTVSCTQVTALVAAAEGRTGVRPWRRTEFLAQKLEDLADQARTAEERCQKAESTVEQAQQDLLETSQQIQYWQQKVHRLEDEYRTHNRPERPYSKLAQARRRLAVQQRRHPRREAAIHVAQKRWEKRQAQMQQLWDELSVQEQRLHRFEQDNKSNRAPLPVVVRIDAGFGTPENVDLLIEMGYEVYTKPQSHWVTSKLKLEAESESEWVRVGANAEMIGWSEKTLSRYAYPLDVALERFHTGPQVRYSTLLHYGSHPVTSDLVAWFKVYNGRQLIEAGIKEGKGIFQMHHLKVRAETAIFLQEYFAVFAANFVRWAAHWLATQCSNAVSETQQAPLSSVKQMVNVTAHTSAWVIWQPNGCLVKFTDASVFAGTSLQANKEWVFQLPLPLFNNRVFQPI